MRLEHPWLLVLLVLVPALAGFARRPAARAAAVLWVHTRGLPGSVLALPLRIVSLLPWLALALAVTALARPQRGVQQSEVNSRGVDIVISIDISPSMRAEDLGGGNRLEVAKQTAKQFIQGRPHDRIGLVGFAATSFTQCPLTLDHDTLIELLGGLDFGLAEDGTAIGMGLATSVQRLKDSKTPSKVVVLLTDGENNRGAIDPLTAADLAKALGVKVYTVLVGRGGLVPVAVDDPMFGRRVQMMNVEVDETTLRQIAARTGGQFFRAGDSAALSGIYAEIDRLERAPIRSLVYHEYRDLGPWLLAFAGVLLALHALSSATWAARLP